MKKTPKDFVALKIGKCRKTHYIHGNLARSLGNFARMAPKMLEAAKIPAPLGFHGFLATLKEFDKQAGPPPNPFEATDVVFTVSEGVEYGDVPHSRRRKKARRPATRK